MRNTRLFILTTLVFFLFYFFIALPPVLAVESCSSGQCHPQATVHPPDKSCTECHKAKSPQHPIKNQQTFSFFGLNCTECHEKTVDANYLHSPVAAGDCYACHTPHGDAKNNYLLNKENIICNFCHNPVVNPGNKTVHGTIQNGKCGACHTHHGSSYPRLLRANYSTAYFNNYDSQHYELCFKCHKIDLLLHPKTSYNTNFRDGKNNLHYLHVNRKSNGRSCKFCHMIHAGTEPKLMKKDVLFGDWQMPINFIKTENGGNCSPGCHKTKSYDRKKRNY